MMTLRLLLLLQVLVVFSQADIIPKDITFRLYGSSPTSFNTITASDLGNFNYDPILKYIVLCHDYNENFNNQWYMTSINRFMMINEGKYAVLAVGYYKVLSEEITHEEALTNIKPLGERIGEVLVALRQKGVPADKIEIVGLGMGAHIAGIAGNFMDKNFKSGGKARRLFGLDPVNPGNIPVRIISKEDSSRTVIIHTSENGIKEPLGHLDFYPNGGTDQSTCSQATGLDYTQIAGYFFACSINQDCRNSNCRCDSWQEYVDGVCYNANAKWASLGYLVPDDAVDGVYYGFNPCREIRHKFNF